jgi:hypothetical protein
MPGFVFANHAYQYKCVGFKCDNPYHNQKQYSKAIYVLLNFYFILSLLVSLVLFVSFFATFVGWLLRDPKWLLDFEKHPAFGVLKKQPTKVAKSSNKHAQSLKIYADDLTLT